jgi:hypothetical protein
MKRGILTVLMKEMADLTLPECKECHVPLSCCDALYCEIAEHYARRNYDVELQTTSHPTLPFMGEAGCVVEPHLRPLCTLHVCSILAFGQKPNDNEWNKAYWSLRDRIDDLLFELQ